MDLPAQGEQAACFTQHTKTKKQEGRNGNRTLCLCSTTIYAMQYACIIKTLKHGWHPYTYSHICWIHYMMNRTEHGMRLCLTLSRWWMRTTRNGQLHNLFAVPPHNVTHVPDTDAIVNWTWAKWMCVSDWSTEAYLLCIMHIFETT